MSTIYNDKIQDGKILKLNSQVSKTKTELVKCNHIIVEKSNEIHNLNQIINSLKTGVKQTDGELNLLRFQLSKLRTWKPTISTHLSEEEDINQSQSIPFTSSSVFFERCIVEGESNHNHNGSDMSQHDCREEGEEEIENNLQTYQGNWLMHFIKSKSWLHDIKTVHHPCNSMNHDLTHSKGNVTSATPAKNHIDLPAGTYSAESAVFVSTSNFGVEATECMPSASHSRSLTSSVESTQVETTETATTTCTSTTNIEYHSPSSRSTTTTSTLKSASSPLIQAHTGNNVNGPSLPNKNASNQFDTIIGTYTGTGNSDKESESSNYRHEIKYLTRLNQRLESQLRVWVEAQIQLHKQLALREIEEEEEEEDNETTDCDMNCGMNNRMIDGYNHRNMVIHNSNNNSNRSYDGSSRYRGKLNDRRRVSTDSINSSVLAAASADDGDNQSAASMYISPATTAANSSNGRMYNSSSTMSTTFSTASSLVGDKLCSSDTDRVVSSRSSPPLSYASTVTPTRLLLTTSSPTTDTTPASASAAKNANTASTTTVKNNNDTSTTKCLLKSLSSVLKSNPTQPQQSATMYGISPAPAVAASHTAATATAYTTTATPTPNESNRREEKEWSPPSVTHSNTTSASTSLYASYLEEMSSPPTAVAIADMMRTQSPYNARRPPKSPLVHSYTHSQPLTPLTTRSPSDTMTASSATSGTHSSSSSSSSSSKLLSKLLSPCATPATAEASTAATAKAAIPAVKPCTSHDHHSNSHSSSMNTTKKVAVMVDSSHTNNDKENQVSINASINGAVHTSQWADVYKPQQQQHYQQYQQSAPNLHKYIPQSQQQQQQQTNVFAPNEDLLETPPKQKDSNCTRASAVITDLAVVGKDLCLADTNRVSKQQVSSHASSYLSPTHTPTRHPSTSHHQHHTTVSIRSNLIALSPASFKVELGRIQQDNRDVREAVARFRRRIVSYR